MKGPIKVGDGIMTQVKESYTITGTITKKGVFETWMNSFKEFYETYPNAIKWDYEEFLREILEYYD